MKEEMVASDEEIAKWHAIREDIKKRKMISETKRRANEYLGNQPGEQTLLSFMSIPMTRTTPFFIMSKREMSNRSTKEIVCENPWGKITIGGRRLCVFDETILLALLAIAVKKDSMSFTTTRYQICKVAGIIRTPRAYKSIRNSILNLNTTYIEMEFVKGKKPAYEPFGHIFDGGVIDHKNDKITINFSEYFLRMYKDGFIKQNPGLTIDIDIKFRSSLKGDIAKALYRFYDGQKKANFKCGIEKLCKAINFELSTNPAMKNIRYRIRTALRELKSKGFLEDFVISKTGVVSIEKNQKRMQLQAENAKKRMQLQAEPTKKRMQLQAGIPAKP